MSNSNLVAWLGFLIDWSIRWGLVLAALALWFALRPPRRAAVRHALCLAGLAVGLLLPVVPRWGNAAIVWPAARARALPAPIPRPRPGLEVHAGRAPGAMAQPGTGGRTAGRESPSRRPPSADPVRAVRGWIAAFGRAARACAAGTVAVGWVVTTAILAVRLCAGWLLLARLRRGTRELGAGSRSLMDECRKALRLSRRAGLAAHPAVASPVILGGLRPVVLVPLDWDGWPESDRRACLLHELSHLVRRDDWAKLVQELVRIPFFFHPLVRWLFGRLDFEREILCDEAVVALGADPVAYARLLLGLARRPGRLMPGGAPPRAAWLPFLDRGTVAARIERLLEDDMPRTLLPPSPRRPIALAAVALAAALGIASLRVRAVDAREPQLAGTEPTRATATAADERGKPPSRTIRGRVLDPGNQPVSGAVVVGGFQDTGSPNHQVFTTDKEGRFSWQVPPGDLSLDVYAHKPGWAAAVGEMWFDGERKGGDLDIKLDQPERFTAVLVDGDRRRVAGARVRVEMSKQSQTTELGGGRRTTSTRYIYYYPEVIAGSPLEPRFVTTTDERGRFSFDSFPPDCRLRLAVTTPDGREMRVKALARPVGSAGTTGNGEGFVSLPPGQVTMLGTAPAARVQGRVTTKLPGVNVAGIRVWFKGSKARQDRRNSATNFTGTVRTDADGRFTFDGLEEGTINLWVMEEHEAARWTYRAPEHVPLSSGRTAEATIELIRGVEVAGKVILQGTGQPIPNVRVGVQGPPSPWGEAMNTSGTTDAAGAYHYRLPPGETRFYPLDDLPAYSRVSDEESTRIVTIPDGVARFEVPPIVLAPRRDQPGRP